MARNEDVTLPAGVWTQLTNADVTAIRVQNIGPGAVLVKARVGAGALTSPGGAISLASFMALGGDVSLSDLFPGVSGANRVYGYSETGGLVSVSHA